MARVDRWSTVTTPQMIMEGIDVWLRKPIPLTASGKIEEATDRRTTIYIRRSTDEDTQPYSLEAHETKVRAFVASQPGDWQIVKVYSDASGASTDRDELRKILRAARAGLFDTVLVYRVDRFSRRLAHELTRTERQACVAATASDVSSTGWM